ncbi:MAG TPA: hypothetical protein VEG34_13610 [Thermoanaerobaculia bacterium]|nr:hypothetical protein [Thermoanaerobaculia bacterium]
MIPLSADTPLDVERIWLDGIRARGPHFQLQRCLELSDLCRQAARVAVRRAHPEASEAERDEILLRELYGDPEAAREVVARRRALGFYDRQP